VAQHLALPSKSSEMIRNIIVIATRVLIRNKIFSLINILGLSIGLACALLILTVVKQQLTFDRFHKNNEHLFCLQQNMDLGTGSYTTDRSGAAIGPALVDAFPEFSSYVRFSPTLELLIAFNPPDTLEDDPPERKRFVENAVLAADSNLFEYFTFNSIAGDLATALLDPYSVVLTRETAEKYFGNEEALNKLLTVNSQYVFTVTAVLEDLPVNSSIQFDLLINFGFMKELGYELESFDGNPFGTFLYMDDPSLAESMGQKITEYLDDYQTGGIMADQKLLSLKHYHNRGESMGQYLNITLILLGIIILSIACINFMNLSTARYLDRTREVGIRKVVGARRGQLIRQFLGETMIITFLALNLSILLVDSIIPAFNRHFELQVAFQPGDPVILVGLIAIFLVSSMVAGSYPAFFLSSFKATEIFHKAGGGKMKGKGIRRILVVVQFLFAILFIITSLVNYQQFKLLNESLSGFDTSNVIYFQIRGELNEKYASVKQEILQNPGVVSVTSAAFIPKYVERGEVNWGLTSGETNDISALCPVSFDFDVSFGMEMAAGRFYSSEMPSDSNDAIIINRAMAEALELEDPVGHTFYLFDDPHTIIGVLENYSFNPLSLMGDKVILPFSEDNNWIFVKTAGLNSTEIIDYIGKVHEKHNPDYPFEHLYLDEFTDPITRGYGLLKKVVYFFTFFGILISCLGLLGLSTYSTQQRTKEIGIRKAMGASSTRILRLFTLDFLKLILVSLLISIPVSILLMRALLQLFVERISMGPGLFLFTAAIVIIIAIITVSFQALRAAGSNPANSLRYE
jgi:putative ABC transport system permease protein